MNARQGATRVALNVVQTVAFASVALLGTAAVQAHRARRRYGGAQPAVPVIDTLARPHGTAFADGRPLELIALGDSAMAGVGVAQLTDTLPVQVATEVAALAGRPVHVVSHAVSGARTRDVLQTQLPRITRRPDVITLLVGTNDVIHFARSRALERQTTALFAALDQVGAPVVVSSLPEFRAMLAIPWLFRLILARKTAVVRRIQHRAASASPHVALVDVRSVVGKHFVADVSNLSADRFHPSAVGYRKIAAVLSPVVAQKIPGNAPVGGDWLTSDSTADPHSRSDRDEASTDRSTRSADPTTTNYA